MERRSFLKSSLGFAALSLGGVSLKAEGEKGFWAKVRAQYDITSEVTNMEAGYWGIMPKPTTESFIRNTLFLNKNNTYFVRREYNKRVNAILERLARKLGVAPNELAITRNATESLRSLIGGYNNLKAGDTVIYANTDYPAMQIDMRYLATKRGVKVVKFDMPEPATHQSCIDAYEKAIVDNPKCKMILVTHLSHRTGLIAPAKEITEMARSYGVDVILDTAHGWGQFDFDFSGLNVDFAAFNLHKWIQAPLGVGLIYIRKDRVLDIDPIHEEAPADNEDIKMRVHTGTMSFASVLTIPDALDFQESIGIDKIGPRLASLRNEWVKMVRGNEKVEVLTPDDPRMHAAITSFRIKGIESNEDNKALVNELAESHGIFTVNIGGLKKGGAIRVSPALYNSMEDAQKLGRAITEISSRV